MLQPLHQGRAGTEPPTEPIALYAQRMRGQQVGVPSAAATCTPWPDCGDQVGSVAIQARDERQMRQQWTAAYENEGGRWASHLGFVAHGAAQAGCMGLGLSDRDLQLSKA